MVESTSVVFVSAMVMGACTEPRAEPRAFSGRYALQSLEGEKVPVVFMTTPYTRRLFLVDTLHVANGHYLYRHLTETDSLVGSFGSIDTSDVSGSFTVRRDSVFLNCPVGPWLCLPPLGVLMPNGDLLLVPIYGQPGSAIYVPVP